MLIQTAVRNLRDKTHDQGLAYLRSKAVFYREAAEGQDPGEILFKVGHANAKVVKLRVDEDYRNVTRTGCTCGKNKPNSPCPHVAAALLHLDEPNAKQTAAEAQALMFADRLAEVEAAEEPPAPTDFGLLAKALQRLLDLTFVSPEDLARMLPLVDRGAYVAFLRRSFGRVPQRGAAFAKTFYDSVPGPGGAAGDVDRVLTDVEGLADLAASGEALYALIEGDRELERDLIDAVMPMAELGYAQQATTVALGSLERALEAVAYLRNEDDGSWSRTPLSAADQEAYVQPLVARLHTVLDNLRALAADDALLVEETVSQVALLLLETEVREDYAGFETLAAPVRELFATVIAQADPELTDVLLSSLGQTPFDWHPATQPMYFGDADYLALLRTVETQTEEQAARKAEAIEGLEARVAASVSVSVSSGGTA